jgi:pilus assembly protein CpaE
MAATTSIPLLLVADNSETCERIASALLSAPAFYRIERITSGEFKQKGVPGSISLALVDQDLKLAKQADVIRQLNAAGIAAVALADARDGLALQEAVLAGAAALVATPFVDSQLWDTVARALTSGPPRPISTVAPTPQEPSAGRPLQRERTGLIVTIYAPKSGSGSSVIAANLAVALQSRAARGAALIEIGEGVGSQGILLNLRSDRTLGHLLARFDPEDPDLLKEVLTAHSSGLQILLSPSSQSVKVPPDMLEEIVDLLQKMFDFVVVDLHSTSMQTIVSTIRKSNATLAVITPEMTSLYHGRQFMELMEANLPNVTLNMVLNRSTLPSGVPADAIRRHLKMQIAGEIPDDQALVTGSVNRGVPFVASHLRSPAARAIQKLAQELCEREGSGVAGRLANVAAGLGPLARLTGRGARS